MIKYTKSKPQCSYLKFRVSIRQATNMKFVMHRYLILRWEDGRLHNSTCHTEIISKYIFFIYIFHLYS